MSESLFSGGTPWQKDIAPPPLARRLPNNIETEIAIIGAGITGAMLADIFTQQGRKVAIIDKHIPETASTAASTALVLWEIDTPLSLLSEKIGKDKAVLAYRQSQDSVAYIARRIAALGLECDFKHRHSLYLEGDTLDTSKLRNEFEQRLAQGHSCDWLEGDDVARLYGFPPRTAIRSEGCAELNPVKLAQSLLKAAEARGADILSPFEVTVFSEKNGKPYLTLDNGTHVAADTLVLATGYEMPDMVEAPSHSIVSTYAISADVEKGEGPFWDGGDIVWEASESYNYLRCKGADGVIFGGEDEEIDDADTRDALLRDKTAKLFDTLQSYLPEKNLLPRHEWTAFFGTTEDSLPLIGRIKALPHTWAAWGYGGNGITFSALAAQLIAGDVLKAKGIDPIYAVERPA